MVAVLAAILMVTVPANFTDSQRQATQHADPCGGFSVLIHGNFKVKATAGDISGCGTSHLCSWALKLLVVP